MLAKKLNVYFLERLYGFHIRVRYLHDVTYRKSKLYKAYSDKKITNAIHKAVFIAFLIILFLTFLYY
ncbi:MAG: hypothetical protein M1450_00955 [Patescibacteria group bacterium]|nr:hypothetical protein [Patescibacteria group bacterium]